MSYPTLFLRVILNSVCVFLFFHDFSSIMEITFKSDSSKSFSSRSISFRWDGFDFRASVSAVTLSCETLQLDNLKKAGKRNS